MDQNMTPNTPENMPKPPSGDNGNWTAPKTEKKRDNRLPIVVGLIGGLSVALVIALLFVTGTVGASPAKKYEKLQKKWLDEIMEKNRSGKGKGETTSVQSDQAVGNLAKSYSVKLSLTEECKSLLGADLFRELELSGDILYNRIRQDIQVTGDLNLNGTNLFQIETVTDTVYQILFARIPQLSEEYLSMDIMDYIEEENYDSLFPGEYNGVFGGSFNSATATMPPEMIEELLIGLKDIWVAHAPKNVTVQKNHQKELGGVKAKIDLYEASWTELELTDCLLEMLKWLQNQRELEDYMVKNGGMDIAEYRSGLNETIKLLEQSKEVLILEESQELLLTIRLGGEKDAGFVEIQTSNMQQPMIQAIWSKGKGEKSEGHVQFGVDREDMISFHYTSEPDGEGRKGVVTMDVTNLGETMSAELIYDGYQIGKDGSFYCHAVLNSEAFQGMGIGVEIDTTKEKQRMALELLMGNLSLGELEFSISDKEYQEFEIPDQSYEITDEEQVADYLELCDMEGFLEQVLENPDVYKMLQMIFGANMSGTMLKEALLESLDDHLGLEGDRLPGEETEGGSAQGTVDSETDFTGYTGYAVDEDGWVSFDPLKEEILAAGKPSTGYSVFPNKKLADKAAEFEQLAKEAYGEQMKEGEPYESNQIYGYEPYVSSYYSKMLEWHEEGEEYIYYLSVAADSVSEEIQNLEVGDTNIERACTLLAKAVAVIEDIDVSELEAALKQSMEEEGDYVSIGNVGIFWYMIEEDYIMLSAYPQQ